MKKRPLCMVCLVFLMIKGIILILSGGQSIVTVPASSIFFDETDKQVFIKGQVYKKTSTSEIQILYLKNNSIFYQNKSFYESNILIYDKSFTEIPIGKTVSLNGSLKSFEKARNPGNFNQQLYYAKQNIYGFLWSENITKIEGKEDKLGEFLYQLKKNWNELFTENMSEEGSGILSAILLSEKSDMESETKELYQKNGIGHILAISGLHISFIGLGMYRLIRKTGASFILSGVLACFVLTLYVMMVGFSVSIIRAYIMLLVRIGADITGRVYDMLTALMFSAAIVISCQPLYLTDAGFYLSHGAILAILFLAPEIEKRLPKKKKWLQICIPSISISIALFPIMLWFYFEIPVYSTILNLMVIPLMSWILMFGMVGSFGCLLWKPFGKIMLKICDVIFLIFERIGEIGIRLPFSSLVFGKPNWWELMIYYVSLVLLIVYMKNCTQKGFSKKTKIYFMGISIILLLSFVKFPTGKVQVTMIDVGQGDSIYLKGPQGRDYLIDGGSSDVDSVGKYRIESFLKSQGVETLEYVFVSHGDSDHYNGILEMIGRQKFGVKIENLVLPIHYQNDEELVELTKEAFEQGIKVLVMDKNQSIQEGNLKITCLQPDKNMAEVTGNARSMVLDVSFGEFDMLLTGDVEAEGEEILIQNVKGKTYDVLKTAHHGSKNSTTEDLLKIVRPRIALISAGKNNSYGHPHDETLARLREAGCKVYQTSEWGGITFETNGEVIDFFSSSI